ncbi:MAG: hypothetical protein KF691_03095 [Phycisphaeraceae bacterium]|nr:hypothetical protein [Phycisphaeraceae bacterium]
MLAGDLEMRARRYWSAIQCFEQAHDAHPSEIAPLRSRCIALYESGQFEDAIASARKVYDESQDDCQAHALYSGMCEFTGNLDELIRVLKAAGARWPDDPSVIGALLLPLARVEGFDPLELFRYHQKMGALLIESLGIWHNRILLKGETREKSDHLAMYSEVDIALDTWPYNGTTTTVEAMYMGVPVVTIAGNSHVSRVGTSVLSNIGLPDLIASDSADYVGICATLASDQARRTELRASLRAMVRNSPLLDHAGFTRRLDAHFRRAWRDWSKVRA